MDTRQATVLLGSGVAALRRGVRNTLEAEGFAVVAEAASARDAVAAALTQAPDLCLLAVELPGGGILAASQISHALPRTRIVMLAERCREEDLVESLYAGAVGYLPNATASARLPHTLRGVLNAEAALPRTLVLSAVAALRDRTRRHGLLVGGRLVELTPREFLVLEHLRREESTAEIAARLAITEVTVRRHVSAIRRKLGARDRRSAVALAAQAQPPAAW